MRMRATLEDVQRAYVQVRTIRERGDFDNQERGAHGLTHGSVVSYRKEFWVMEPKDARAQVCNTSTTLRTVHRFLA